MFKLDIEKGEEPEIKLPTSTGSQKKQEFQKKKSTAALLTMPKTLTVWITKSVENSPRDGNTRPPDPPPEKNCMQIKKQQLKVDMEQHTGSKLGKESVKAVYRCCLFNLYAEHFM